MASTLTITQLEPPRRVVVLSNSCAPRVGFEEGTEQRGDVAYHKGSNIGRARLDGSMEDETEYEFLFRDRNISSSNQPFKLEGSPNAIATAAQGLALLKEMARDSVTISLEFEGEESIGFIRAVRGAYRRLGEREVTLVYQPTRPAKFALQRAVPMAPSASDTLGSIRENWLDFLGEARVPIAYGREQVDRIQRAANGVNTALSEGAAVINEALDLVDDARGVSEGITGPLGNIKAQAAEFLAAIKSPAADAVQSDDPVQIIAAMVLLTRAERTTRQVRHEAAIERRRFMLLERDDIIGVHVTLQDEDIRLICFNAYGSAAVFKQVMEYNGLKRTGMVPGQRIILPRIDAHGLR